MTRCPPSRQPAAPIAGQTMIFMIMALLIMAVVIVWIFEVHTVLHLKARTQNAGDAAAIAAARWQGISLNLIGDLNILQALALSRGDTNASAQITDVQARLGFVGPLVGLLASQQAAKNNRAYVNPDYTANLLAHADLVRSYYAVDTNRFPEPYGDAWLEYGNMLANIAAQGVAAGPDNTKYYTDSTASHWLLSRNFYWAVAGLEWCWFYWHGLATLQSYSDFQYWPELPTAPPLPNTHNCEIFGLGLVPVTTVLPGGGVERMNQIRSERGVSPEIISNEVAGMACTWYEYAWSAWTALAINDFPMISAVKPQYDYAGADTVIRVEAQPDSRMSAAFPSIQPFLTRSAPNAARLTQSATAAGAVTWTAAAKPFGYIEGPMRPNDYTMVLPAFRDVRLIPVDAATGANIGAYDLDWRRHIQDHLPAYMQSGQAGLDADCWYCRQLQTWEDPAFRQQGIDWLNDTNHTCATPVPGGTRRGH
ncbi:MAG: pilus assembly protein TadG-related protein [Verrucomicrobiota bacterium]